MPLIAIELPVKLTVPLPGVNVPPLFDQLPATLTAVPAVSVPAVKVRLPPIVKVAGAVKSPDVSVRLLTVSAVVLPPTLKICPTVLAIVTWLNVWLATVPLMACAPVPSKVTVPLVPGVNVPPLFDQLPLTSRALVPALSVPAVSVTLPLIWCDKLVPRLSVPPVPLMVSEPAVTLPPSVAVLAVRVKLREPVVAKPAMLGVVLVPPMVIVEPLAVNVPLLLKPPLSVTP